ncbi:MAG: PIN domain-containing protein [Dehalococcoidia bacterium]|nr:PIN domain-containing protein [Dehalococcoidia bacterium]
MALRFLDTNILIRLLTRDDEEKAAGALALLLRVERGEEQVAVSPMVVFEAVFILEKSYGVPRTKIRDDMAGLLSLRGLRLAGKQTYHRALDLYAEKRISFADAFNAALMRASGITEIYTWDTDFDRLEGIRRLEPEAPA